MSSKDKYGKFKKKDYVRVIDNVRRLLCAKFGYEKKPYLIETELFKGTFMMLVHSNGKFSILYDYKQFKNAFQECDYDLQEAYAATIMAHEMRHYYQHRQMIAKKPKEDERTIELWRENEWNPKELENGYSLTEVVLQPLELDANLYEYVFGAVVFDKILFHMIQDEEYLNAMEKLYVEYFGETDERLFNNEIRAVLNKNSSPNK